MSFANIRTYIGDKVRVVDSTLIEHDKDPINTEDVARFEADKFYKIVFGPALQTNTPGNAYGLEIPVNLIIFSPSTRAEITAYDALYQKAVDIRNGLLNPCDVKNQADFSDMVGVSITPGEQATDDKLFFMDLEFILRIDNYYT